MLGIAKITMQGRTEKSIETGGLKIVFWKYDYHSQTFIWFCHIFNLNLGLPKGEGRGSSHPPPQHALVTMFQNRPSS